MSVLFRDFLRDEAGATAVEYGLIAALIGLVSIASLTIVGDEMDNVFSCIQDILDGNANCGGVTIPAGGGGGGP